MGLFTGGHGHGLHGPNLAGRIRLGSRAPEGDKTNRDTSDPETFQGQGNKLGSEISTGTFEVRISPYMPIQPRVWFDTKQMQWADRVELSQERALSMLREAIQSSPQRSLLVIVWGYRDWFQSAGLKTAYTAYVLDINTPVLLFDWPGNGGAGASGYRASREVAYKSGPDLGRVLAKIIRETDVENIWLMGSSLGCQTICDAFSWMITQPDLVKGPPKIDFWSHSCSLTWERRKFGALNRSARKSRWTSIRDGNP